MFVAVMLVLGYVERMIPLGGMPGIKLGLSNSVLLLTLYWLGIPISIQLMVVKVVLSGFAFNGVDAMMYALAGGALSLLAMSLAVFAVRGVSPVGAGIVGGVMHNVGQVALAMFVTRATGLLTYMAVLMVVGAVMGAATGTVARLLMGHLPAIRQALPGARPDARAATASPEDDPRSAS